MPSHKTLVAALVAAQANMGKALKQSTNPHFRSKYADIASVMDATLPALNAEGIAVMQPSITEDGQHYVATIFLHADSGELLDCKVPLIIDKNNMQGYGSAHTYARRYGLLAMAGIAPEDDDGNAAAAAPPKRQNKPAEVPAGMEPAQPMAWENLLGRAVIADAKTLNQAFAKVEAAKLDAPNKKQAWDYLTTKAESIGCEFDKATKLFITSAKS